MTKFARSVDGAVFETLDLPDGETPQFHSDLVFVECPAEVTQGWLYNGTTFSAPPGPSTEVLKNYARIKRQRAEVAGITVGGTEIATDRRSQSMITGAYVQAMANPSFVTQWKQPDGSFAGVNASQIIAMGNAVAQHISNCFTMEATIAAGIDASPPTVTSFAEIDTAFANVDS